MRKLLGFAALLVASPAVAAPNETSNPAFLGVGMNDVGNSCVIQSVTKDSGAHLAGIRIGDTVVGINGAPITNCSSLVTAIHKHEPGVAVKIDVQRNGVPATLVAMLPSRADVLRKRFVGKPMPIATTTGDPIRLVRVDDQAFGDLSSRGQTTIVGMFDADCFNCARSFSAIRQWAKTHGGKHVEVVGVTAPSRKPLPETIKALKERQHGFDVPLMVISDHEAFSDLSINDDKRIHFLVIDPRGIVCYATPLKPDADDRDAVLGELYAATEHAARRVK